MLKLANGRGTISPASLDIYSKAFVSYFNEKLQLLIPIVGILLILTGIMILSPAFALALPISTFTKGLSVTVTLPLLTCDSSGTSLSLLIPEIAPISTTSTEYFLNSASCLILNLMLAKLPSFIIGIAP